MQNWSSKQTAWGDLSVLLDRFDYVAFFTCFPFKFYFVYCAEHSWQILTKVHFTCFCLIYYLFYNLFFLSCPPDEFWIVCLYIAIDIDATGLDAEENDIPANHRSPKPSANSVTSPHSKEKRMPFFKKVTLTSELPSVHLLNCAASHF